MTSLNARITYWWTLVALMVPNVALSITEHPTLLQGVTNVVLPLGVVWVLMTLTKRIGVSVWALFVLMFLAAFQLVLLGLYGRSVIAVDMFLNIATTNSAEAGELLAGMLPSIILVMLLYLPPLVGATVAIVRKQYLSYHMLWYSRCASRTMLSLGVVLFGLCMVSKEPYSPMRQLYPLNALYNMTLAIERSGLQRSYLERVAGYRFAPLHTDGEPTVTMIVIGETSRASSWGLFGYGRPTTPRLSHRAGVIAFPYSLSQSNTTHKSVPLLLSHLRAEQFADSIYSVKGLLEACREAGCHTAFVSNQERNGALIDAFGEEADTCIFLADRGEGHLRSDMELLPVVDSLLRAADPAGKLVMVIHTYGSHYRYSDRYQPSEAVFVPDRPLEAAPDCREMLVNAYDNSIRVTDRLLDSLMAMLESSGAKGCVIYTADHGEDIYDDSRRLFLHASPIPSFEQLHVPMLVWLSGAYREAHPSTALIALANSRRPVATSASLFPTAMTLAGISGRDVDCTLSLACNEYTPHPYRYLDDHNEAVTPRAAGLDPADCARIDTLYTRRLTPEALALTSGPLSTTAHHETAVWQTRSR